MKVCKNKRQPRIMIRERSGEAGAAQCNSLTDSGKARAKELIQKSNEEISLIIDGLSTQDCRELIEAIDTITRILSKGNEK